MVSGYLRLCNLSFDNAFLIMMIFNPTSITVHNSCRNPDVMNDKIWIVLDSVYRHFAGKEVNPKTPAKIAIPNIVHSRNTIFLNDVLANVIMFNRLYRSSVVNNTNTGIDGSAMFNRMLEAI